MATPASSRPLVLDGEREDRGMHWDCTSRAKPAATTNARRPTLPLRQQSPGIGPDRRGLAELPRLGAVGRGQGEVKHRATWLAAFDPYPAAVRLDKATHDSQPQP